MPEPTTDLLTPQENRQAAQHWARVAESEWDSDNNTLSSSAAQISLAYSALAALGESTRTVYVGAV